MYWPYSSSLADSRPFMDVQSLIRNLAQDFVTSFNTGSYAQAASLFASDGAFMAPHHDPAYGPKSVERLLHHPSPRRCRRHRIIRPVPAFRHRLYRRKILVISIRIPEEKQLLHPRALLQPYSMVTEELARHPHQRDLPVEQRHRQPRTNPVRILIDVIRN